MRTVEGTARSLGIEVVVGGRRWRSRASDIGAAAAKIDRDAPLPDGRGGRARCSTPAARRSSTRRSRSRCGSASIRGRPTRTCAARSCCRTAPARRVRVLVFAKGEKAKEAQEAGADHVGADDMVKKIQDEQWLEFDTAIATPDMMGQVGRLGKVLGPRGLMPNPKVGTVTFDVGKAVREVKAGKVEFRVEKAGIVHVPIGKRSFGAEKLLENAQALLASLHAREAGGGEGQLCPEHRGLAPPWGRRCGSIRSPRARGARPEGRADDDA